MFYCKNKPIKVRYKGNFLVMKNAISEEDKEVTVDAYWQPPVQQKSSYNPYTYEELINEYDKLMA